MHELQAASKKGLSVLQKTMRAIRKTNTKPEIRVRKLLHGAGYRFRIHATQLPGTPDIVLRKHRAVFLVNGCFWHQHQGCRYAKVPRTRPEYWIPKLARNVERDSFNQEKLRKLGWRVCIIWECETEDLPKLSNKLSQFLLGPEEIR
jgi:DNA mismatch endonuclease (patch repair protein)